MGHEIELVVGLVHKETYYGDETTKGKDWLQVFANVDMRKPGYSSNLRRLNDATKATSVHLYAIMGDGDTSVVEDRYGAELTPIPIQDVINALRMDAKTDNYRRIHWALALLEAMVIDNENFSVVLWGY